MPLYEYKCEACGSRFEKIRKFSDPPLEVCEKCGKGPIVKLLSSPAIQFKGSGFYITDYAKKSSPDSGGKSSSGGESSADAKSDAKSDSKADSKTDTKKTDSSSSTTSSTSSSDKKV